MDRELLENERVYEGDDGSFTTNDTVVCKEPREEDACAIWPNLTGVLWQTIAHYFPQFNAWIGEITDVRDQDLITYASQTIIMTALLCLIMKRGARRKITIEMRLSAITSKLKEFSGQDDLQAVPHDTTVDYLLKRSNPEEYEEVLRQIVGRLIRQKIFDRYRLLGMYYVIAVDGVHVHTYRYKHCDKCVSRTHTNGTTTWHHYVLQASLVTENGMCIPVACEWIENAEEYRKQDCEHNAFYRLIRKIRQMYPKLPICLVLDSLYCGEPLFQAIEAARMEWIVVFKKGSMPEIYEWTEKMMKQYQGENTLIETEEKEIAVRNRRTHQQRLIREKVKNKKRAVKTTRTYTWGVAVEHWENKRAYNVFTCKEIHDSRVACDYRWLCSDAIGAKLNKQTIAEIANNGGRCRWKIENQGNNMLKNGGYNLEHPYSKDENAGKCWYILILIAHIINQLIEKGSLIVRSAFGSIRDIATRMFEHFCYLQFTKPSVLPKIQIRLDSS